MLVLEKYRYLKSVDTGMVLILEQYRYKKVLTLETYWYLKSIDTGKVLTLLIFEKYCYF